MYVGLWDTVGHRPLPGPTMGCGTKDFGRLEMVGAEIGGTAERRNGGSRMFWNVLEGSRIRAQHRAWGKDVLEPFRNSLCKTTSLRELSE